MNNKITCTPLLVPIFSQGIQHKPKISTFVSVWIFSVVMLLIAACTPPEMAATAPASRIAEDGTKSLVFGEIFWPSAGFAIETDDSFNLMGWGITETLVKVDFEGQMVPFLAESWTQTDDTTWSFTLREGIAFQNGEPFNADAVAIAFNHLLNSETPPRGLTPENIASIEAADERTVVIRTVEPDVLMPNRMTAPSFGILAPSAYDSSPTSPFSTGTGPFILIQEEPDQSATLVKNEDYWGGEVALDEVLVLSAPDGDVRATMLRTGEIDIAESLPIPQIPLLEAESAVTLARLAEPRTRTLYLNNVDGPMADVEVRRAVLHAIDKQSIVDAILEGVGEVAAGPFGPTEAWVNKDVAVDTYDPEKAKQILADAGYAEGDLSIEIATYPSRSSLPPSAIAIQQMLGDVGITAEVRIAPYSAVEPDVLAGDFDIFIVSRGHLLDNYDPEGFLTADFSCGGGYNLNQYCNETVDNLLAEARTLSDSEARFDIYRQIQSIVVEEDVASIFLNYTEDTDGYRAGILNYRVHPLGYYTLTPELDVE
ncbi:MAG: ABC transporter substrate-binding protein [Chloroflexota bacterium]